MPTRSSRQKWAPQCPRSAAGLGSRSKLFYRWRSKYAGMLPSDLKRLKQLEEENSKLKKLVADLSLDKVMLQDVLSKKW